MMFSFLFRLERSATSRLYRNERDHLPQLHRLVPPGRRYRSKTQRYRRLGSSRFKCRLLCIILRTGDANRHDPSYDTRPFDLSRTSRELTDCHQGLPQSCSWLEFSSSSGRFAAPKWKCDTSADMRRSAWVKSILRKQVKTQTGWTELVGNSSLNSRF